MYSHAALLAVGGVEAAWGAWVLAFPSQALPLSVGRLLSVGATSSSPALSPMLAQTGALRLALGVLVVAAATGDDVSHELEACVVAHACLLQPFLHAFRSHPKLPTGWSVTLSLLEGGALVAAMAADAGFDVAECKATPGFLMCAAFFAVGLLLALVASLRASLRPKPSAPEIVNGVERYPSGGGGATPLLFDSTRHQLSPNAKRLLA